MKKILLEPAGRVHSYLREMARYPPQGYEFVLATSAWDRIVSPALGSDFLYFGLQRRINRLVPVHLVKARLEGYFKRPPQDVALTYAFGHLVFRKEPWVVELEWPHQLTGFSYAHLRRFQSLVETTLGSPTCRRIICWCELARISLSKYLSCQGFDHKIEVIPHAVAPKNFVKADEGTLIKLLFVGSVNIPGEFYAKGGNVVVEAFRHLRERYANLELVIRSDVPGEMRRLCQGMPNLRILESTLRPDELDHEFRTAHVFLFPAHQTPFMVLLEAMSYELPIIAADVYATREIVQDGETGFLISPASHIPYYVADKLPTGPGDWLDHRFKASMRQIDLRMVQEMVQKTSLLIEDAQRRRSMGKRARWGVEHGRFSLRRRNDKLKKVLDDALDGGEAEGR